MPQYFIAGIIAGLYCLPLTVSVERVKCVMQVWSMEYAECNVLLVLRSSRVVEVNLNTQAL